jgi:hypothetical protein
VLETTEFSEIPKWEGIYAFFEGDPAKVSCAYVGETGNLNSRIKQHLVLRNSSVTTGRSVVCLRPEQIRYVQWWDRENFADKTTRLAAELVAFDVLDPTLRSRAGINAEARALSQTKPFRKRMKKFFDEADGQLQIRALSDLADMVVELETRLAAVEALVKRGPPKGD